MHSLHPHVSEIKVGRNGHWSSGINPFNPDVSSKPHGTAGWPGKAKIPSKFETNWLSPHTEHPFEAIGLHISISFDGKELRDGNFENDGVFDGLIDTDGWRVGRYDGLYDGVIDVDGCKVGKFDGGSDGKGDK